MRVGRRTYLEVIGTQYYITQDPRYLMLLGNLLEGIPRSVGFECGGVAFMYEAGFVESRGWVGLILA